MAFTKNLGSPQRELTTIEGEIIRITYSDENTGFHIIRIQLPKGGPASPNTSKDGTIVVKLNRPGISVGMTMAFHGNYVVDPKYGHQFKAESANEVIPSTTEGMIAYLSSSFFHGIGPVKARKIVNRFKDKTMDIFNNEIHRLLEVRGITEKNLENIKEGWEKNKEINSIMQFLMDHGLSSAFAGRVYEYYGNNCIEQIKQDPYELSRSINGIGFRKADSIALGLGFAEDSHLRIKACIEHVISSSEHEGHCYLYLHQIINGTEEYLGISLDEQIRRMLHELEASGSIIVLRSMMDDDRYYGARIYRNESYCHRKIMEMAKRGSDVDIDKEDLFKQIKENLSIELSDQQKDAVVGILRSGVAVLTGAPGTGKTSSTKALVEALGYVGMKFLLCAPTGRAAKRMRDTIGHDASTIHRLLSWDPATGGFAFNEKNKLQTDCVLIDEFSMVDIHLAASLLRAIPDDAMVVFIGDPDQLPPVGAGNFFRDLIDSSVVNVFRLTQIFRQGKGSQIIDFSHAINKGEVPNIETPLMNAELWKTKETDCLFIDSGLKDPSMSRDQIPPWMSLRYGFDVIEMLIEVYRNSIPRYYNHPKDIQILIPMKKGPLGTVEVNRRIQEVLNPKQVGVYEMKVRDLIFRENDKVIQTVNNYNLNVFNGDVGRIVAINEEKGTMSIDFDDVIVTYERPDMLDLDLAYAISIHKSQGSEFDFIIIPLMNAYYRMLYRQLIYTGLTRAKKLAVFIGQRDSMTTAVNTLNSEKRQTSLKDLLMGLVEPAVASGHI
jgi:exodeoxyribonuclease V alpha subunit